MEDDHARRVAGWVATLANVAGNGPKRPLKPDKLWTPNLVEPKPKMTQEERDAKAKALREERAKRRLREHVKRLAAQYPFNP